MAGETRGMILRSMTVALNCGVWMHPRRYPARSIHMRMAEGAAPTSRCEPGAGLEIGDSAAAALFDLLAAHIARLDDRSLIANANDWQLIARPEQLPPEGDWRTWLMMGGRGSGKTRAGAEWVHGLASGAVPGLGRRGADCAGGRDLWRCPRGDD
jgi:hypothetical protein